MLDSLNMCDNVSSSDMLLKYPRPYVNCKPNWRLPTVILKQESLVWCMPRAASDRNRAPTHFLQTREPWRLCTSRCIGSRARSRSRGRATRLELCEKCLKTSHSAQGTAEYGAPLVAGQQCACAPTDRRSSLQATVQLRTTEEKTFHKTVITYCNWCL